MFVGFLTGSFWSLFSQGTGLTLYFRLFCFGFLDRTYNKGRQRSLLRPFRESLRTRDLELPLQKRLVRRQWLAFAPCLLLLVVLVWFFLLLWDAMYWDAVVLLLILLLVCAVLALGFSLEYLKRNRRLAEDIGLLTDRIAEVRAGELSDHLELPEDTDLREAAENLNEISQGMEKALEELDFGKLLRQILADMNIQIKKSELTLRTTIPDETVLIQADGQRLYRVFQNLIQNALQYSLKGSRVYLTLTTQDGKARPFAVRLIFT